MNLGWIKERCIEDGDCWLWKLAASGTGQPRYTFPGTGKTQVRRLAWTLTKGPIPAGLRVTTSCGNPRCLNPTHLELATCGEIISRTAKLPTVKQRRSIAGAKSAPEWKKKLDPQKVRHIRTSEQSQSELAQMYGVSQTLIANVRTYKAWKTVDTNPFAGLMASNDSTRRRA